MGKSKIQGKYDLYYTPSTYYLTESNEYVGHIKKISPQGVPSTIEGYKTFVVEISYSKIKGFYNIMIPVLADMGFIVMGDINQTDESIGAWKKLLKAHPNNAITFHYDIQIYDPEVDYWDKDHYRYRVGFSKGNIKR